MEINGSVVIITGASSGIGAATARACAEGGASVVLAARSLESLKMVQATLPQQSRALSLQTGLVERTIERFGRIDVLVNNAGFGVFREITEMSVEEFDNVLAVNLRGTFLCMKYVLPHMYRQRSGNVVTISSIAGKHGFANGGAYCSSKFGLMGLTESVFHEARTRNVRIITLTPGSVNTPFFDEAGMTPPNRERIIQPEDVASTILHALTLPDYALIRELDIRPTNPRG
jgi:3-oxoacyl-[acyl-carrier protein] reductase